MVDARGEGVLYAGSHGSRVSHVGDLRGRNRGKSERGGREGGREGRKGGGTEGEARQRDSSDFVGGRHLSVGLALVGYESSLGNGPMHQQLCFDLLSVSHGASCRSSPIAIRRQIIDTADRSLLKISPSPLFV